MTKERTGGTPATRAKNKYNAKAYDQFLITVPAGQKAEIDKSAKEQGYSSRNKFVIAAINEKRGKG
ncbi:MAG: ribbon-helix-helix domain-containing protein [Eubacteriales bacterium]|nr:ribbon-helix-helix domain-containing protein [Eubacteriales bacterium]